MSIVTTSGPTRPSLAHDLEDIFNEHAQLVYRTAYGVMGSHEDAEDVLQTIFLRLLRRAAQPDLNRNPKAYLYRAAVNLSLDMIRSGKRHVRIEGTESLDLAAPSTESIEDGQHRRLYEAIAELKPASAQI